MPLKLTLKPNEKVLIGTSVIANGPAKTEFVVLNRVPVVRERDIITEEKADTVAKKLYVTILNMYINPAKEKDFHGLYFALMREMILIPVDARAVDLMVEMSQHILAGVPAVDQVRNGGLGQCQKIKSLPMRSSRSGT
jgi:flagellar biosynthesis repressor protein FlbT